MKATRDSANPLSLSSLCVASRTRTKDETYFFLAQVEEEEEEGVTGAAINVRCDVDHTETVRALWLRPSEAVRRSREGQLQIFPPQFYILSRLAELELEKERKDLASVIIAASRFSPASQAKETRHCPPRVMQPLPIAEDHGGVALALPFDEHYEACPGPAGARHRVNGFPKEMDLELNAAARLLLDPLGTSAKL